MSTELAPAPTALHPFYETLGPGPYRFVGCYDLAAAMDPTSAANFGNLRGWLSAAPKVKAGLGTCAHCGTAILNICIVRVGNGDLYGVGEDCVEKCSQGGLWKGAKAALAARRNAMARARKAAKAAAKWEAERPERERRQQEAFAKAVELRAAERAKYVARIEQHRGTLDALVGEATIAEWIGYYDAAIASYDEHGGLGIPLWDPPLRNPDDFHTSLARQLIAHGSLSPRQADYATKATVGRRTKANADAYDAHHATLTA